MNQLILPSLVHESMEPEAPWPVLSQEAISKLASGVHYCFLQWTALQLAISNEWGGRNSNQKALQLENDVVVWFAHSRGANPSLLGFFSRL